MVVAEQDAVFAGNILDALHTRGIREPSVCRSAEALTDALGGGPDLILCDVDLPGLDFCAMAQDIRHGRVGRNPFAVLIATARPSTGTDLARVMQSGIDYIVLKPMTADQIVRRIDGFARSRKPFVVTETFIGPSRRVHRRDDGSDDDLVIVPNTLRIKVRHNNRLSLLSKVLEVGHKRMGAKKSETRVRSVARLVRRLADLHTQSSEPGGTPAQGEWNRTLTVLVEKSEEVVGEHKGSSVTDHVGEIAARILQLTRRWADLSGQPPLVEMALAGRLSDALLGALSADTDIPEIAREIAAVVDNFLGREQSQIAGEAPS
jgi:DNA-binding response OmpR family regulator